MVSWVLTDRRASPFDSQTDRSETSNTFDASQGKILYAVLLFSICGCIGPYLSRDPAERGLLRNRMLWVRHTGQLIQTVSLQPPVPHGQCVRF